MAIIWQGHVASEHEADRKARAQAIVAYLSYALEDVRALSPTGSYLLELSIKAIKDDLGAGPSPKSTYS
ncbi:MAG: hypothetical protein ACK4UO_05785 [Pseudolabrys sp.]